MDVVLTNPPFGKKSSITVINDEGETDKESITYNRPDFWTTTSNKQLNFVQHVKSMLKIHGRAAVVVPDNVLFEGGAGEKVRRKLLQECEVHTLLRLPTGIFYAQGVKANVHLLRPQAGREGAVDQEGVDLRLPHQQGVHAEGAAHGPCGPRRVRRVLPPGEPPPAQADVGREKNPEGRWRVFTYEEIVARDKCSLDIFWLKDETLEDSAKLPDPHVLAAEIAEDLRSALEQIEDVLGDLQCQPHWLSGHPIDRLLHAGTAALDNWTGRWDYVLCRQSPICPTLPMPSGSRTSPRRARLHRREGLGPRARVSRPPRARGVHRVRQARRATRSENPSSATWPSRTSGPESYRGCLTRTSRTSARRSPSTIRPRNASASSSGTSS